MIKLKMKMKKVEQCNDDAQMENLEKQASLQLESLKSEKKNVNDENYNPLLHLQKVEEQMSSFSLPADSP